MKSFDTIRFAVRKGIAEITLHRPDVLNAMTSGTLIELLAVFSEIKVDTNIKAVILTGTGTKSFCTGLDLKELEDKNPKQGREFSIQGQGIFNFIEELGKPVIAAINGYALGGGCELALACTLRIASRAAKLGFPEVGLGIIPAFGGTYRLPRLIGLGRALELILTGKMITGEEAYRIGLVNAVTTPKNLLQTSRVLAETICVNAPLAVSYALESIYANFQNNKKEGFLLESSFFGLAFTTKDKDEGLKAFFEKRAPVFVGK